MGGLDVQPDVCPPYPSIESGEPCRLSLYSQGSGAEELPNIARRQNCQTLLARHSVLIDLSQAAARRIPAIACKATRSDLKSANFPSSCNPISISSRSLCARPRRDFSAAVRVYSQALSNLLVSPPPPFVSCTDKPSLRSPCSRLDAVSRIPFVSGTARRKSGLQCIAARVPVPPHLERESASRASIATLFELARHRDRRRDAIGGFKQRCPKRRNLGNSESGASLGPRFLPNICSSYKHEIGSACFSSTI